MKKLIYEEAYRFIVFKLKEKRKELGLRQEDLGKILGKYQKYIDRYENFSKKLDLIEILELCKVLKIDFISLMKTFETIANQENGDFKDKE